ncbi:MAG: SWIM zinc finger family protein [Spirochaetaceae bacterium]|jgi:uncharacterized Zn finger protein|nr:SWIM zinc finger family protein [Spirochaetaceae bacterium]
MDYPLEIRNYKDLFSSAVWNRGVQYYQFGYAQWVDDFDHGMEYEVQGSVGYYRVRIWDDSSSHNGFRAECNCPYHGPCKHIVAVILDGMDDEFIIEKAKKP